MMAVYQPMRADDDLSKKREGIKWIIDGGVALFA